jgi:hypothetical protein
VRVDRRSNSHNQLGGKSGYLKRIVRIRLKVSELVHAKTCGTCSVVT